MSVEKLTSPAYTKLTATAVLATSTFDITYTDEHSGYGAMNSNPNVYDCNLALGNMRINLPSLSNLFTGTSLGLAFEIRGTITVAGTDGAARTLVFVANLNGTDTNDTICGSATATLVAAVGTTFMISPSGKNNWSFLTCAAGVS